MMGAALSMVLLWPFYAVLRWFQAAKGKRTPTPSISVLPGLPEPTSEGSYPTA
jgi:hypothetical protein